MTPCGCAVCGLRVNPGCKFDLLLLYVWCAREHICRMSDRSHTQAQWIPIVVAHRTKRDVQSVGLMAATGYNVIKHALLHTKYYIFTH